MNAGKRWLASVGIGIVFGYESHELANTIYPRRMMDGIAAEAHDVLIEHIESIFPVIQPPTPTPEPLNQNWQHHNTALIARWNADRAARIHAANAALLLTASRGVVLRSLDHETGPVPDTV